MRVWQHLGVSGAGQGGVSSLATMLDPGQKHRTEGVSCNPRTSEIKVLVNVGIEYRVEVCEVSLCCAFHSLGNGWVLQPFVQFR